MLLRRRVLIRTLGRMALERTIRRNEILSVFVAPPHESCTMRSNCSPWPKDTTTLIDCTLSANVKFIMKPSYRVLQRVSQQKSDLLCLVTTRRRVDGIHHKIITLLQRSIGYVRVLHTFQCDRPPALRQTLVVSFRESDDGEKHRSRCFGVECACSQLRDKHIDMCGNQRYPAALSFHPVRGSAPQQR